MSKFIAIKNSRRKICGWPTTGVCIWQTLRWQHWMYVYYIHTYILYIHSVCCQRSDFSNPFNNFPFKKAFSNKSSDFLNSWLTYSQSLFHTCSIVGSGLVEKTNVKCQQLVHDILYWHLTAFQAGYRPTFALKIVGNTVYIHTIHSFIIFDHWTRSFSVNFKWAPPF